MNPYSLNTTTKFSNVVYKSTEPGLRKFANRHRGRWDTFKITIRGNTYMANPMILCERSGFFQGLLNTEWLQMKIILNFLYTNEIDINCKNVYDLLMASEFLIIEEIKNHCITFLMSILTHDNYFVIVRIADVNNSSELLKFTQEFRRENCALISRSNEFKDLAEGELVSFLSTSSDEEIPQEENFSAIVEWVNVKPDERRSVFGDLLKLINIQKMSPTFLQTVVAEEELVKTEVDPIVWQLLNVMKTISLPSASAQSSSRKDVKVSLVIGGGDRTKKELRVLDLTTREFVQTTNLPFEHNGGCTVVVGVKIFCFGGDWVATNQAHVITRTADGFEINEIRSMNVARYQAGAAVLDGSVYVSGGRDGGFHPLSSCEAYSVDNDSWTNMPDMSTPRSYHALASCDGRIICAGGSDGNRYLNSAESFDPRERKWSKLPPMNCARSFPAGAVIGNQFYAIGGRDMSGTALKSVERYANARWETVAPMNLARCSHAACVVDGRIFVVGGQGDDGSLTSVEVYDPTEDTWTIFCQLDKEYLNHSVVAL